MTDDTTTAHRTAGWEHFAHGADVGVRGFGPTREAAFEQAARALVAVVADDAAGIGDRERVEIACTAPDDEILLVDWLNALVFEMATRAMLFGRFTVRIEDDDDGGGVGAAGRRLSAEAWGEPVDLARHAAGVEVKGATYTALGVGRGADGTWVAQCVVDV